MLRCQLGAEIMGTKRLRSAADAPANKARYPCRPASSLPAKICFNGVSLVLSLVTSFCGLSEPTFEPCPDASHGIGRSRSMDCYKLSVLAFTSPFAVKARLTRHSQFEKT